MSRVLVTGGAGFLGSHLCQRLLDNGHEVICLDNFSTGRLVNISNMIDYKRFKLVEHDVIEPFMPYGLQVDQIFNLACPASPPAYQLNAIDTMKTNVYGMVNMLDIARLNGATILQASTSEVYGDPLVSPQPETYWGNVNPNGIRSCYDEGKRAAESLCFDYKRQHGVDVKVARIFNTYGPQMDPADGRVVSNFIMQALQGKDITIYGDGSQTRSFQYVTDLIDGFMALMYKTDLSLDAPVNLGNPVEFTILELAQKVIDMTDSDSDLVFHDLPGDDPKQRCPDTRRAEVLLPWNPRTPLSVGLVKTIEYFEQYV
jgi:UDP-glucuronate decarboxylase|tara:strand:+ start:6331 stop:7275 length:945 start_codon:yes stop_codon:yes gene_type:complete